MWDDSLVHTRCISKERYYFQQEDQDVINLSICLSLYVNYDIFKYLSSLIE